MKKQTNKNPLPELRPGKALYAQVADAIADHIAISKLTRGDRLPSQSQLMKTYGVSQATVRQALLNLSNRGLARAEHGRGVFVDEPRLNVSVENVSVARSDNADMRRISFDHIDSESVFSPERVAALLRISTGTPIIRVRRIMRSDMRLIGLETSNLPFEIMQLFSQADLSLRSFDEALSDHAEFQPTRSVLKMSAGLITDFDANVLGVSSDTITIQKEETFFSVSDHPVMMQRTVLIAANVDLLAEIKR